MRCLHSYATRKVLRHCAESQGTGWKVTTAEALRCLHPQVTRKVQTEALRCLHLHVTSKVQRHCAVFTFTSRAKYRGIKNCAVFAVTRKIGQHGSCAVFTVTSLRGRYRGKVLCSSLRAVVTSHDNHRTIPLIRALLRSTLRLLSRTADWAYTYCHLQGY